MMRTIFFILLTLLVAGIQPSAQAMWSTVSQARRVAAITSHPPRTYASIPQHDVGEIHDYQPERDEKFVAAIAMKHMYKLASDVTEDTCLEIMQSQVIDGAFKSQGVTSKVYLLNGQAVGFINYTIFRPWHDKLLPYPLGPNATIDHLAVDNECQGMGVGTALLNCALQDCQKQSVGRVTLRTTEHYLVHDKGLFKYYKKFGFDVVKATKYGGGCTEYAKRLKPHPIVLMSTAALEWLRRFGE